MHTLKRFIQYLCACNMGLFFAGFLSVHAIISLVDLAFPQILRTLTKYVVCEKCVFNYA